MQKNTVSEYQAIFRHSIYKKSTVYLSSARVAFFFLLQDTGIRFPYYNLKTCPRFSCIQADAVANGNRQKMKEKSINDQKCTETVLLLIV